jgi:ABC-2 type transport system permease protein
MSKEARQMVRDPSVALIAFVLPIALLLLFTFAVSLDIRRINLGLILDSDSVSAQNLAAAYTASPALYVRRLSDRHHATQELVAGRIKGFVVIPSDFDQRITNPTKGPLVEIVTDGSSPSTAGAVSGYSRGALASWQAGNKQGQATDPNIVIIARYWYNQGIESRQALIPGAIAIVMTMIGTLLTSLVVAREWERGTMEALLSTPASVVEILAGKLLPYLALGLLIALGCSLMAVFALGLPLRGSWFALTCVSLAFLVPALGQGLLISAATKNQFLASQLALFTGFLPAFMLSGFLFEIGSMPAPIQAFTHIVGAKYYIDSLRTIFLVGDIWASLLPNIGAMLGLGLVFIVLSGLASSATLDGGR